MPRGTATWLVDAREESPIDARRRCGPDHVSGGGSSRDLSGPASTRGPSRGQTTGLSGSGPEHLGPIRIHLLGLSGVNSGADLGADFGAVWVSGAYGADPHPFGWGLCMRLQRSCQCAPSGAACLARRARGREADIFAAARGDAARGPLPAGPQQSRGFSTFCVWFDRRKVGGALRINACPLCSWSRLGAG